MGGAVKAIEQGYIQKEIAEASYEYQKAVENGTQVVVGVNKFTIKEEGKKERMVISDAIAKKQYKKIADVKAKRDTAEAEAALAALKAAAATDENLMPYIVDCARKWCTEGEICNTLRAVFGEYKAVEVL